MEKEAKNHENRRGADLTGRTEFVFGYRLEAGDRLQPDDVYDSTSGQWEKAPISGLVLEEGAGAIWVRPVKQ